MNFIKLIKNMSFFFLGIKNMSFVKIMFNLKYSNMNFIIKGKTTFSLLNLIGDDKQVSKPNIKHMHATRPHK